MTRDGRNTTRKRTHGGWASWLGIPAVLGLAMALAQTTALAEDTASSASPKVEPEKAAESPAAKPEPAKLDPAIAKIDQFIAEKKVDHSSPGWKQHLPKPPKVDFDPKTTYYWELDTNHGKMTFALLPKVAPMHVSSTIYLTRLGFYDDVVFHRVIPGFMAQGGDPTGTGRGGPGYAYAGEFDPKVKHDRPGMLSMANAGPGTDGSQFFITFVPTPHLDGRHTIFGRMRSGNDTLSELQRRGSPSGRTQEKLQILSAKIRTQ